MDLLFALLCAFGLLMISGVQGVFIAYPLLLTLILFVLLYLRRGYAFKALIAMIYAGAKKSFAVLGILLPIGALTAAWIASGTVPALVFYGINLIHPEYFVLSAFLLTSLVSVLLGTSFGVVGTIGVALMIMARGSEVNLHLVAGAIIAGAYFGDRCSPMSSSAHLVATLTQTKIYCNLKAMAITSAVPLLVSISLYYGLSRFNPIHSTDSWVVTEITALFDLHPVTLAPAIAILGLVCFRVDVKLTMLISLAIAGLISLTLQHHTLGMLMESMVFGYHLENASPLQAILTGGGLLPMGKVALVVIVSTGLAGLFSGTQTLVVIEQLLQRARSHKHLFLGASCISLATAALGCTQTIAILMTHQLTHQKYAEENLTNHQLAIDIENTAVVLSPLIPWNIAGWIPATLLMTDAGFIPYAFFLYLLPLFTWLHKPAERRAKPLLTVSKDYS